MVKRRVMKKSLGKRRQRKQTVTTMVRYVTPKQSAMYTNIKVECSEPIWIYGNIGGQDAYSFSNTADTWHKYVLSPAITWANFPELRAMMNSYNFYKVNGASIAFVKSYGTSAVNEIRQAPPIAFNLSPALSNTQVGNLTKSRIFDMDDSYRVQPLSDDKEIGSRYYKFKNMRSGIVSTYPQGLGEWESTTYPPTVLLSIGSKDIPESAADTSIKIGAVIVNVYISFKKPCQSQSY